jgi:integrase
VAVRCGLHFETGKGQVAGPTKTKKSRPVDLRRQTVEVLRRHRARQAAMRPKAGPRWEERGLGFTTETGQPLDQRRIQRLFDRACERAGIPRCTIKETRHTFATLGLIHNIPVKKISELLGHATTRITQDIYSHVIPGMQGYAFSHLDRLFG